MALQVAARTPPDRLEANREILRALLGGEHSSTFEQRVGSFGFADALELLEPTAKEKGILPP